MNFLQRELKKILDMSQCGGEVVCIRGRQYVLGRPVI